MTAIRIGQGIDIHAVSGDPYRRLVLGGVEIPDAPGLVGHSDADVVLHALTDALLGAAALGDLGSLVGVDDPQYANADSGLFLDAALQRLVADGWQVGNTDLTVVAQAPRLSPYRDAMTAVIARHLQVDLAQVSVKATTTDRLGAIGGGHGIACMAVVLIQR